MKYLSIWENPDEVLDFLIKWDFITHDEAANDYDLLRLFEGDPDYLELENNNKCYFTGLHPDYTHECESVILTTSESYEETELIQGFMENIQMWRRVDSEGFRAASGAKIAYRGGRGYVYGLYCLA